MVSLARGADREEEKGLIEAGKKHEHDEDGARINKQNSSMKMRVSAVCFVMTMRRGIELQHIEQLSTTAASDASVLRTLIW